MSTGRLVAGASEAFLTLGVPTLLLTGLATMVATPMVVRRALAGVAQAAAQAERIDVEQRGLRLPVDPVPLADLAKRTHGLRLVLLNALGTLRAKPLLDIIASGEIYVEISMLEGVGGVGNLLAQAPAQRVLFGSHAPLFYFEAALLKLKESALNPAQLRAIRRENAQLLLAKHH